jgi:hypothetical protein
MPATTVEYLQQYKEDPPKLERSLYLIVHDQQILDADPEYKLMDTLRKNNSCRLRAAKLLKRDSKCFHYVPAVALDRFFALLDATPESAGKQRHTVKQLY